MPDWIVLALVPLAAYAIGCANGAYYLVLFRTRQDLRTLGSGTAGARNAGRVLGRSGFILSLAIDAAKGVLVLLGARAVGGETAVAFAAPAVIAGHVWPVQLRFKGGKGAATAIGVFATYSLAVTATVVPLGLLLLAATRRLMVGGFVALVTAPVAASIYGHDIVAVVGLAAAAFIVVIAHRVDVAVGIDSVDAKLNDVPGTYVPR